MITVADEHGANAKLVCQLDCASHADVAGYMAEPIVGADDARRLRTADLAHCWSWIDALVEQLRDIAAQVLQAVGDRAMQVGIHEGPGRPAGIHFRDPRGSKGISGKG